MTHPPTPAPDTRRLKVILCGYGHLGLSLLRGLLDCTDFCEVVGVFRWSTRPASKNIWEPIEDDFARLVKDSQLPELECPGLNSFEFAALLEKIKPDVILVGAWGEIIKPHLINRPDVLLVNCHPSKLPAHRGANPYSTVICHGETETGVTFHRITPAIDAGAILAQGVVPIDETDNGASVRDRCAAMAYTMMPSLLRHLADHLLRDVPLREQPQDESQQSYFPALKPEDGLLHWTDDIPTMSRQMRGLYPWIVCYSYLAGRRKVLFFDPRFVTAPENAEPAALPGRIMHFYNGGLLIATSDPRIWLQVTMYRIAFAKTHLPIALGKMLACWWLRPGQQFCDPL